MQKNPTGEPFPGIQPPERMPEERLDSWKEIAAYLKRDVTTVQRWERQEGMPVHRHLHHKRGSVYALSSELDAWVQGRKLRSEEEQELALEAAGGGWPADDRSARTSLAHSWLLSGGTCCHSFTCLLRNTDARKGCKPGQNSLSGSASLAELEWRSVAGLRRRRHDRGTHRATFQNSRITGYIPYFDDALQEHGAFSARNCQDARGRCDCRRVAGARRTPDPCSRTIDSCRHGRAHLGGEYQREYHGILEVQEEVARNIVEQIELNLTPEERARLASRPPVDPEAYESYLRGRYYFSQRTEDALHKSIASFQQAIMRDPGYAPAYSGLAEAYAMLGFRGGLPSKDALSDAKKAALKAIELDDALAEPHASLAFIAETYEWDWPAAEREYKQALELDPGYAQAHNWYGGYLTYTGRFNEGVAEAMRARELDPLSLPLNNALAGRLLVAGRYDEALRQVQTTLELNEHFAPAHQTLGWVYLRGGKQDDAIREFQNALELAGAADMDIRLDLGFAYAVSGRTAEARRILANLQQLHQQGIVPAASLATLYGALGESNEAFVWLEKAYQERDPQLTYLKTGRRFEPLHGDPRFGQFVRRVGFPE